MRRKRVGWVGCAPIIFGATNVGLGAIAAQNGLSGSSNWSGYYASASSGNAFSDISSTWVVPTVQALSSGTSYNADWVGLDGATDTTVEQCGTLAYITSHGSAAYYAWYEFYPDPSYEITSITVHPGDTMHAEVTYEASESSTGNYAYYMDVSDQTTGISYSNTFYTSSNDARSSAEWIAEAPSNGSGKIYPLANFGSVTFSNDVAAMNGGSDEALGALSPNEIEMIQSNSVVALPTSLNSTGEAFNINYGSGPGNLTWDNAGGASPSDGKTWDIGTNNNWNSGTNATFYPDGSNVTFNDNNNGHYAVTLNTTVNPASVTVNNNSGNYTISGTGSIAGTGSLTKMGSNTLTLSTVNTYSGGTIVNAGTLVVGVTGALPNRSVSITGGALQLGAGTGLAQMTSLSITGNGVFDINNNHIIINYGGGPDPISAIAGYLASGYAGGTWTGPGIMSTAAQSNSGSYGVGYADSADPGNPANLSSGQIEIKYTLLGDTNLDGMVNGADFTILATNLGKSVSGWDQGNFLYTSTVTGTDFTALVSNLGKTASGGDVALPAADYAAVDAFAAANGLMADVPEPGQAMLLTFAGLGILMRRRRATHS
ncbi:MAG: G1 family glutamic endopeptidase [Tepidisphaeraceae bacterium]